MEDLLAELAAAPPAEFTQARDALVARLKALGQAEAATRIKAARRPTAALWAANRVAREERDAIEQLIAAADRMRAAQLGRGAGGADLASAGAEQRAAIAHLTQRAGALLVEAGLGTPLQVMARVETTLVGAAGDPDLRPALRQGRLERELAARGFDAFAGETLPPRRLPEKPPAHTGRRAVEPAAPAAASATRRNQEREARLYAARAAVAEAEARVTRHKEQVESARKRVEELNVMLRDAKRLEEEETREEKRAADALHAARETLRTAERG